MGSILFTIWIWSYRILLRLLRLPIGIRFVRLAGERRLGLGSKQIECIRLIGCILLYVGKNSLSRMLVLILRKYFKGD